MPIDYRIPYEIGSQRSKIIDPATLASLREKVAARQQDQLLANQKYEADQREVQNKNTLRQLLSQAVKGTDESTGRAIVDPAIAQNYMQRGGSMSDLKAVVDMAEQKRPGFQLASGDQGYYGVSFGPQGQPTVVPVEYGGKQIVPASVTAPVRAEEVKVRGEQRAEQRDLRKVDQAKAADYDAAQVTLGEMDSLVADYKDLLKTYGSGLLPQAELDSAYAALLVNYNAKVAQLGALAGPDVSMLEKIITPPRSVKGAYYGDKQLLSQIDMASARIAKRRELLQKQLLGGKKPGEITIGAESVNGGYTPPQKRPPLSSLIKVR